MATEEFDFLGVADRGGMDVFCTGVTEDIHFNGDNIALMFITLKEDFVVALAKPGFFVLNAGVVLPGIDKRGNGPGGFGEIGDGEFSSDNGLEQLKDLGRKNGGSGIGEGWPAGARNIGGVFGQLFEVGNGFLFFEPALGAALAPVREIFVADGHAVEMPSEDGFNRRQVVEPRENVIGRLAIFEAGKIRR